jgi:hypothetical protein
VRTTPKSARATRRASLAWCAVVSLLSCTNSHPPIMTDVPPQEVHTCANLIGFWQFAVDGRPYFGVLERSEDRLHSVLTIARLGEGKAEVARRVENEDVTVQGIDARVVDSDLVLVLQINRTIPAQTVRTDVRTLVDPSASPALFQSSGVINLTAQQEERVRLPSSEIWNVADVLAPEQWVFNPRLVRGDGAAAVIANAADGQAMTPGVDAPQGVAIPDAPEPQALVQGGRRYVAFRRLLVPYFPYSMRSRAARGERPPAGDLMMVHDRLAAQNLSVSLGVGPVLAFALAAGVEGAPWIFALQDDPAGARVVALVRGAEQWAVADRWTVGVPAERVSAEHGLGGWHLLYAARGGQGWTLHHELRPLAR